MALLEQTPQRKKKDHSSCSLRILYCDYILNYVGSAIGKEGRKRRKRKGEGAHIVQPNTEPAGQAL